MEHLFVINNATAVPALTTTLPECGFLERRHLQEWVIANPQILGDDVMVVTAEYDRWAADADGAPARDRLDVLGLDGSGRLVVVELKRAVADRDVHLQAVTYAALVSRFTLETLAEAHRDFVSRSGHELDLDECREKLLEHAGGDLDPDLLRRPRQVLIAGSFPKQVTHTVVWLSEMNLDIDLIQVSMWRVGEQVVAGFTKVYPTPEAEEFTLTPARAGTGTVMQRVEERTRTKNVVHRLVDAGLLPEGTRLRMVPSHGTTSQIREDIAAWAEADPTRRAATWKNTAPKPLVWDHDGQQYSMTGLANHVFTAVTGRKPDGIQGTAWWVVDGQDVPGGVDPTEWAALDGRTLLGLAADLTSGRRGWEDLHALLDAIPAGRWTTYGDVATAIGSHAVPVGSHLAACTSCPHPWRVLNSRGRVSPGFRWADSNRQERPEDLLVGEGIPLREGLADPLRRLRSEELEELLQPQAE